MNNKSAKIFSVLFLFAALLPGALSADDSDSWEYGLSIYGWFPDISGTTAFPLGQGEDFTVGIGEILDNLQFTFQGAFDARKGNWGLFTDVIYMDLGDNRSAYREGTIGGQGFPVDISASANFDMKSWIWTTAAYYRVVDEADKTFDFLFGVRYADVEQSLNWSFNGDIGQLPVPGREGRAELKADYWDGVIGLRGRLAFGTNDAWFIPYYADIGTGGSDFTWQAFGGIGYGFDWGEITAAWRYLDYDLPSGKPIGDIDFSGPLVGVVFRW